MQVALRLTHRSYLLPLPNNYSRLWLTDSQLKQNRITPTLHLSEAVDAKVKEFRRKKIVRRIDLGEK